MRLKMLQTKLMKAVINIIGASILISSLYITILRVLSVASMTSKITIAQIITKLARAPRTSARWYP